MEKRPGFAPIVFLVAIFVALSGAVTAANVGVVQTFPRGQVLSKGSDDSSSGSGSHDSDSNHSAGTESKQTEVKNETEKETEKKAQNPTPTIPTTLSPTKTEFRAPGTRVKTENETNKSKVEIRVGGLKIKYEVENGRVKTKFENEAGKELDENEIPEAEKAEIENEIEKDHFKVSTASGSLAVATGNIAARVNIPLQVNLVTNELIASTSAGLKVLTVLPNQAVTNMLAANVLTRVNTVSTPTPATPTPTATFNTSIVISDHNGNPVYEIEGVKTHNLFGFIPVTTQRKVVVSAQTGQLESQEESLLARIVDLLSP